MDIAKLGVALPFGVFEDMPTEQLQSCFTAAPGAPVWKGVIQLASEAHSGFDAVIKTPGIDQQSLDRAVGGQIALETLMGECIDRILATRGEEKEE